jgi:hypothetical protein
MTVNPTKTSDDEQICALDKHAKSSGKWFIYKVVG